MTELSSLDSLLRSVLAAFPALSNDAQRMGFLVYDLLSRGRPVSREALASAVCLSTLETIRLLDEPGIRRQALYDERRRLIGFGGLSIEPTRHRLSVGDRQLFTWCAWDALFIPALLGRSATVLSRCPASDVEIRVNVSRDRAMAGSDHVLSFVTPRAFDCATTEQSRASFCSDVSFFASRELAKEWFGERPRVSLLTIADGFRLGQAYNAVRFPDASAGSDFGHSAVQEMNA